MTDIAALCERLNQKNLKECDEAAAALTELHAEVERLRELFKKDGEEHASVIRDLTERHDNRIRKYADAVADHKARAEALAQENARLREGLDLARFDGFDPTESIGAFDGSGQWVELKTVEEFRDLIDGAG